MKSFLNALGDVTVFAFILFMSRSQRIRSSQFPYHISARCINRDWFRLPIDEVWEIFSDYLFLLNKGFDFKIHNFVLMSNHFHMIASTPKANISDAMLCLMTRVSKEITFSSHRINQTFSGPFHSSLINTYDYYMQAYKYVYRNPVEAGMVEKPEQYRFSTLHGLVGQSRLFIPIEEDTLLLTDPPSTLAWLNRPTPKKEHEFIRAGLKKAQFELPKDRETRKPVQLST